MAVASLYRAQFPSVEHALYEALCDILARPARIGSGVAHTDIEKKKKWWYPNLSFAKSIAFFWYLRGLGTIVEYMGAQERTLWVQGSRFLDFGLVSGPHFESCSVTLTQQKCIFHSCFQVIV